MRLFYVTDKWTWDAKLFLDGVPFHMGVMFNMAHFIQLEGDDKHILLSGDLKEGWEPHWHSHPLVARLPHPQYESSVPIHHLYTVVQLQHKNFCRCHYESIRKTLGLIDGHTVWDLHDLARKIHPEVRLDHRY